MVQNKTFCGGDVTRLNACVGENGWNDIYTYADGYLEATKELLRHAIQIESSGNVDILVYPIVYNARHGLELMLKATLLVAKDIRTNVTIDLSKVYETHDLGILWLELKSKLGLIDKRFIAFIDQLDEHIFDYSSIDPNGQIFRYPQDRETKQQHLKGTSLISLAVFQKRFQIMSELIDNLYNQAECLREEYSLGTFTAKLSRAELSEIATKLPPKSQWTDESFLDVKQKIRTEYSLTSNDFCRALNAIQNHPEFATKIGIEIPLKHAKKDDFLLFFDAHKMQKHEPLQKLNKSALAEITALYHLGRHSEPCERFSLHYQEQFAEVSLKKNIDHYLAYYFLKNNFKEKVLHGLIMMGNESLSVQLSQNVMTVSARRKILSNLVSFKKLLVFLTYLKILILI